MWPKIIMISIVFSINHHYPCHPKIQAKSTRPLPNVRWLLTPSNHLPMQSKTLFYNKPIQNHLHHSNSKDQRLLCSPPNQKRKNPKLQLHLLFEWWNHPYAKDSRSPINLKRKFCTKLLAILDSHCLDSNPTNQP